MTKTDTVIIDGQAYDAVTGMPVQKQPAVSLSVQSTHVTVHQTGAIKVHSGPQHSITLQRKVVKKPVPLKHSIVGHPQVKHMDIARPRHQGVAKFAPHPVGALQPSAVGTPDIGPITHPHVAKAHAHSIAKEQQLAASISAADIKNQAVKNAVEKTHKQGPLKNRFRSRQRIVAILSATLAVVLLGGYLTYLNMPALSVRVAAAEAGIDASYPDYRPDGYALNGPVTYSQGKVAMNFKANGGNQTFSIDQSKSSWDSGALLDNYVSPRAGSNYIPYSENGLTIYIYGNNAAWVNGGILYTIEGDAPLSSTQMREIATSLL
jgi:hypothetical protein